MRQACNSNKAECERRKKQLAISKRTIIPSDKSFARSAPARKHCCDLWNCGKRTEDEIRFQIKMFGPLASFCRQLIQFLRIIKSYYVTVFANSRSVDHRSKEKTNETLRREKSISCSRARLRSTVFSFPLCCYHLARSGKCLIESIQLNAHRFRFGRWLGASAGVGSQVSAE